MAKVSTTDGRYVFLDPTSRHKGTSVGIDARGRIMFDPWKKTALIQKIIDDEDFAYHTMTYGDVGRWDALAKQYYGTEKLGWVLRVANTIIDPIEDAPLGTKIKVPSAAVVNQYVRAN